MKSMFPGFLNSYSLRINGLQNTSKEGAGIGRMLALQTKCGLLKWGGGGGGGSRRENWSESEENPSLIVVHPLVTPCGCIKSW